MSTPAQTPSVTPILSTYAGDPDMADLIQLFVEEIPDRVRSLQQFLEGGQLDELRRIAHQLKGASGGYGFATVGAAAGVLEHELTAKPSPDLTSITRQVQEIVDLCARVRAS